MKKLTFAALGILALASLPAAAADWSDTYLGFHTGTKYQEPGYPDAIKKNIITLNHVSGYSLGSNFFNVDMLSSDDKDPSNGSGSGGAQEVYVAYRHNLSLSKLFSSKMEFGPVRDVEFTAGFDYSAKNTAFAPKVFKVMAGPTFSFKVPGFATLGILYYKEKNHNGILSGGKGTDVSFDPTYQIAAAWGIDIPLGPVATKFKGFGTYTGTKGKDGFGVETKPETLIDLFWMFDASPVLGAKKGTWQIGPGFQYWNNKFGGQTVAPADAPFPFLANPKTTCVQFGIEYHF
jgi:hypothetical protein